jgi:hypothetical protein
MLDALETVDDLNRYIAIMGFRGSAKSTILEAFALWSMVNDKHNFIVYIGATIDDSKLSLANIRDEIEQNEDFRKDFGIVLRTDEKGKGMTEKWSEVPAHDQELHHHGALARAEDPWCQIQAGAYRPHHRRRLGRRESGGLGREASSDAPVVLFRGTSSDEAGCAVRQHQGDFAWQPRASGLPF